MLQDDQWYVIDRLLDRRDTPTGRQYLVRWYGYNSADDTYERAENLPQHLVTRFDRRRATRRPSRRAERTD